MGDADETFVIYPGERQVDGGGGTDLLDFGTLQGHGSSYYGTATTFGGKMELNDPATGQSWTLDWANIENFQGGPYADRIDGSGYTTFIAGGGGDDTLFGGMDTPNAITMFGGEGNDSVNGAEMGDTINGNQGDDVVHGWDRDDWLYGGKDNDVLYGDDGDDNANGNLGNDTIDGGAGADTLHGGQGNDVLTGGAGADWLSGDLGDDTMTGGAGADVFHVFAGGGADRITDFNAAEGDRVQLDPGSTYTVAQQGADVVISISGGAQVVLAGVQLSSLTGDWIFIG